MAPFAFPLSVTSEASEAKTKKNTDYCETITVKTNKHNKSHFNTK